MVSHRTALLVVALLVSAGLAADGDAPAPRKDRHGDPLPADALERFGTLRWKHGNHVSAVAIAPDKKHVVSTANDGTIRIWDAATGQEVRRILPENPNRELLPTFALSPDGKTIAAPISGKVRFWELATGKEMPAWDCDQHVTQFSYAPDGKTAAVVAGQLALWDVAKAKELRTLKTFHEVLPVAFSADGSRVAAGDGEVIRVWDAGTGKLIVRLARHVNTVTSVAFSPDGKTLASAGEDNTVRLWDIGTGKQIHLLEHANTRPSTAYFVLDGNTQVRAWVFFTPDGKALISCVKGDRFIRQWETASGKEQQRFAGHPDGSLCLALSADGTLLAAGAEDSAVRLWDRASGKELFPAEGHRGRIFKVGVAPDGRTVFSVGRDNTVRIWDVAKAKELRHFMGDADRVGFVVFSPDGKQLATGRKDDEIIELWDMTTGKRQRQIESPHDGNSAAAFAPDGKRLATVSEGHTVCVWDTTTGEKVRDWKATPNNEEFFNDGGMHPIAWSPDGKRIATLPGDANAYLWDPDTGKLVRKLPIGEGRRGRMHSRILFSPDGQALAIVSRESIATLFALPDGEKMHTITNLGLTHPQGMTNPEAVVFSSDGKLLIAAGADSKVRAFEVATGKEVRSFATGQGWVSAVAVGPDPAAVVVGGLDTTVLLCDLSGVRSGATPAAKELGGKELDERWDRLHSAEADEAYRALWDLSAAPASAVPFLRERVKPLHPVDGERLKQLIADLDGEKFAARQKAEVELEKLGELAVDALNKVLSDKPALELQKRCEALVRKATQQQLTGARLRTMRAITALELMKTPEAKLLLDDVAKGVPAARQSREAKAALERLDRQSR